MVAFPEQLQRMKNESRADCLGMAKHNAPNLKSEFIVLSLERLAVCTPKKLGVSQMIGNSVHSHS
jgi:hypothetical protein